MDSKKTILVQILIFGGFLGAAALLLDVGKLSLVFIITGGILITLFTFRVEEAALPVLLLLTLALGSCYKWDIAMKSFYVRFLVVGLIALRAVLLLLKKNAQSKVRGKFLWTPVHMAVFLVAIYGLITSPYSVGPSLSFKRATTFLLLFFVIFIYFWLRSDSAKQCEKYALSLWKGLAIILSTGFVFLAIGMPGMFYGGRLRLVIGNPNQLGHYCAIMAPIAVWYLIEKSQKEKKLWRYAIVAAIFFSLIGSGSRGALLTTAAALGIQFGLCYRKKIIPVFLSLGLIASIHYLLGDPKHTPGEDPTYVEKTILRSNTLESGSGRRGVWRASRHLISKRPYFGYGFGTVDRLIQEGYFPNMPVTFQGGHVHNSYLEELVNLGWIGSLPIFLAFLYMMIVGTFRLMRPVVQTESFRFACALFSVVIAGMASGIFESWFTSVGSVFCFPYWMVVILFLKMISQFNDWQRKPA